MEAGLGGYFTEERFVCTYGLIGSVVIPYKSIRELGKCSQGLIPMGITITYEDPKTGKAVADSFSLVKREKWLEFLADKAGSACS